MLGLVAVGGLFSSCGEQSPLRLQSVGFWFRWFVWFGAQALGARASLAVAAGSVLAALGLWSSGALGSCGLTGLVALRCVKPSRSREWLSLLCEPPGRPLCNCFFLLLKETLIIYPIYKIFCLKPADGIKFQIVYIPYSTQGCDSVRHLIWNAITFYCLALYV